MSDVQPATTNVETAIAAILYERGEPIEEFMATLASTLSSRAIHVGGLVQHNYRTDEFTRCRIELENIITGTRYQLTQNLGSASQACALDITALADASSALRQAIAERVEVVIINKFGTQEAAGGGLRNEMMLIALTGIPIITAVSQRYLSEWQDFAGTEAVLLPMTTTAVMSWWQRHWNRPAIQTSRTQTIRASV